MLQMDVKLMLYLRSLENFQKSYNSTHVLNLLVKDFQNCYIFSPPVLRTLQTLFEANPETATQILTFEYLG